MAADPERIEGLRHDWERAERTWRSAPSKKFSTVMEEEPAKEDAFAHQHNAERDPGPIEKAAENADENRNESAGDEDDEQEGESQTSLPRFQPDPRMRALHARFETQVASGAQPSLEKIRDESSPSARLTENKPEKPEYKAVSPRSPVRKKAPKRIRG